MKPYKINDRRSSSGYLGGGNNWLVEAATPTTERFQPQNIDQDFHRTISNYGRRVLMNMGRDLFWKFPALQGAVLEQANVAVSSFIPQYTGRNKQWGAQAEVMLGDWHRIMDIAGWPYDYDTYLQSLVIAPLVDGENFTLLTETPSGYPMIQVIPAHRVGKYPCPTETVTVRYSGTNLFVDGKLIDENRPSTAEEEITFEARMIDGAAVDAFGRAISYRVFGDNGDPENYQDIPARNMFPAFMPMMTGQIRGLSLLASSAFNWQDMAEWTQFERIAHKAFSTRTIVETNETGDTDTAKAVIQQVATFNGSNQKTSLDVQRLDGGTYSYLKANTGSKLEQFDYNRPGPDSQNFMNMTLRDAFKGTEWDIFFSLDPQAVGGAPMRVIVEKINLVAAKRRKLVKKCCLRVDGYAIAKLMKSGALPWDDDWYMWDYQGPGEVTADKKYDSDVDLQEVSQGVSTRKLACARRGLYIEDVDAQREAEARSDLQRAERLAKEFKITIQEALVVLRPPTPNQQLPSGQGDAAPTEDDAE